MDDEELIVELRNKASECRRRAEVYDRAADELEGESRPPADTEDSGAGANGTGATGRMLEIARFLDLRGPATRGQVMEHSGVPPGTVRALLNRNNFERDDESGRWVRLREDIGS